MLPTLRAERRAHLFAGAADQPDDRRRAAGAGRGGRRRRRHDRLRRRGGERIEQSALGGLAKLQWKVDWAMRWVALGVDYEMAGKDLIDSVDAVGRRSRACSAGARPRASTTRCSSTSTARRSPSRRATACRIDEWLTYGPEESLAFFAYREPRKAKQLHMGVIPRAVDEYWQFRANYPAQELEAAARQPRAPHPRRQGARRRRCRSASGCCSTSPACPASATATRCGASSSATIPRCRPRPIPRSTGWSAMRSPMRAISSRRRCSGARRRRAKRRRCASSTRRSPSRTGRRRRREALQNHVYEIGKTHFGKERLRDWFKALYETLLGSPQGPRMGSFFALYGVDNIAPPDRRGAGGLICMKNRQDTSARILLRHVNLSPAQSRLALPPRTATGTIVAMPSFG